MILNKLKKLNYKIKKQMKLRMKFKTKQLETGFTLIELVVVLSLLLLVLAGVFNVISLVQKNYNDNNIRARILEKTNTAILQINNDIRSASKPNNITNSIVVHPATENLGKGQSIDIYYYDKNKDKYYRIGYRLLPDDKSKLQRGQVECSISVPDKEKKNPQYGDIIDDSTDYISGSNGKWKTILTGIQFQNNGNDIEIFKDISVDENFERRAIKLFLLVNDDGSPSKNPVTIDKIITSRTKGSP